MANRLVRIPRELLHVGLEDLGEHGVPERAQHAFVALLADLPFIPSGEDSAILLGQEAVTLPCLVALARHVGQALRDRNVALLHDRPRLHAERLTLAFLSLSELEAALATHHERLLTEAVVVVSGLRHPLTDRCAELLRARTAAGRTCFVSTDNPELPLPGWRMVDLRD